MIGFLMDGRCKLQVQARIQQLLSKGGGVSEKWLDLSEGGGVGGGSLEAWVRGWCKMYDVID